MKPRHVSLDCHSVVIVTLQNDVNKMLVGVLSNELMKIYDHQSSYRDILVVVAKAYSSYRK